MGIKNTNIVYTPINALSFKITGYTESLEVIIKDDKIVALHDATGPLINLGMTVDVSKIKYKVNLIQEETTPKRSYLLSVAKRARACVYILPMLGESKSHFLWDTLLLNVFIGYEDERDVICVLFRFSSSSTFLKLEQALQQFSMFKKKIDVDPYHVMFIFDVPKTHKRNYNKLKQGKYSEMSLKYKERILQFHGVSETSQIGQVLSKSPARRKVLEEYLNVKIEEDSELLTPIDFEEDIFKPEVYKVQKSLI
jgi:hypothetical protein